MEKAILTKMLMIILILLGITSCSSLQKSFNPSPNPQVNPNFSTTILLWEGDASHVWDKLQHTPPSQLALMEQQTVNPQQKAWLELALLSKRKNRNTSQLAQALIAWRTQHPRHSANSLFPSDPVLNQLQTLTPPQQIALLLPQSGTYAASGQKVRQGFLNAYYVNLAKIGKQNVKFYDTTAQKNVAVIYQQALAEGADFVVGPLVQDNVQQLSRSNSFHSPTLALNYTEKNSSSLPTNFYEFGLLTTDEINQLADQAYGAGRFRALVIAPQNAWGNRLVSAFSKRYQAQGGKIQTTWYYSNQADFSKEIAQLLNINPDTDKKLMKTDNNKISLEKQRRQDFDAIFLFAQPQEARTIVPLLHYYYAANIPIYASSSIYADPLNATRDIDLKGLIVCDLPGKKRKTTDASDNQPPSDRLYAVGQDAYLLSQSLQRLKYLPNFPIYGTTGALTLSAQQIHRRLPCTA